MVRRGLKLTKSEAGICDRKLDSGAELAGPHHFGSLISNPKRRSKVTVSSSVRVRPTFSCSLIRCVIISALSTIQSGTLAIVTPSSIVAYPIPASRKTLTPSGLLGNGKPVKTRCVIHEQLSLARLADIFSLAKDIDRAVEPIAVRDIRAIDPALVAELFDGERQ